MDREEKKKNAETLHEELAKARGIILSGFQGITVAQDFQLRRKVAGTGARYKVVKNTLIERAAKGTPVEPIAQRLAGTTSIALTEADPVALAKALTEYAKENPILTFKCGVVEGRVVSLADLVAIASLPPKEQLLSKVLFLFNSPAQRVASTLSGVARNLVFVIEQGVKKEKFNAVANEKVQRKLNLSDECMKLTGIIDWTFNPQPGHLRETRVREFLEVLKQNTVLLRDFDKAAVDLPDVSSADGHDTRTVQKLLATVSNSERDSLTKRYQDEVDKVERDYPGLKAEFANEFGG